MNLQLYVIPKALHPSCFIKVKFMYSRLCYNVTFVLLKSTMLWKTAQRNAVLMRKNGSRGTVHIVVYQ